MSAMMKRFFFIYSLLAGSPVFAAWYWPFGENEDEKPRMSVLLEPASELIDSATDLAQDGRYSEAIAEYNRALAELDRIEIENPDRIETPEFTTVRNKRAIVNSYIDTLLMEQVRKNAKAVAVTDTTELEKRYARKKGERPAAAGRSAASVFRDRMAQANAALRKRDFEAARAIALSVLEADPDHVVALNVKAAVEMAGKEFRQAEETLYRAIQARPKNYCAYYNMARLMLSVHADDGKAAAKRYYGVGRDVGGPVDEKLEEKLK
jgi:tetratricopeptide (TPR) repeat protein